MCQMTVPVKNNPIIGTDSSQERMKIEMSLVLGMIRICITIALISNRGGRGVNGVSVI